MLCHVLAGWRRITPGYLFLVGMPLTVSIRIMPAIFFAARFKDINISTHGKYAFNHLEIDN